VRTILRDVPVRRSARVRQIEGMMDVPPAERSQVELEIPDQLVGIDDEADWRIGLIVGPSGSGKTTIANELWGDRVLTGFQWATDEAVIDAIDAPIRDTVQALTAVGFGSPPAWVRPYFVLSTGEQFRATVARALLENQAPVIDEFTSVVDRQVASVASAAIHKLVHRTGKQLVAVTCHYDVIDWLQPDWAYRPDSGQLEWRSLQRRPELELEVRGVSRRAWSVFRAHHYLSADLHVAARCVGGFIGEECVAFCAYYRFPHPRAKDIMLNHRTVVLPDYQGLGIGEKLSSFVGQLLAQDGDRFRTTLIHPALVAAYRRSPRWREVAGANAPSRSAKSKRLHRQHASTRKLATKTFEYVPV
jgi:GNAT superfamily N-acetyltransferase